MKFIYDGGMVVYTNRKSKRMFLFLNRSEGWLDMPKGHIEKNETALDAAIRETFEESGLKANPDKFFKYATDYWYNENGEKTKKTITFFLSKVPGSSKVKVSWEHSGYEWLDFGNSMKRLKFDDQKKLIKAANEYIDKKELIEKLNNEYKSLPSKYKDWNLSSNFVAGEGPLDAKVIVIGQAPGRNEDIEGRPFVGISGKLLDNLINKSGLKRSEVYITSVVQFFPPKNRMPSDREIAACKPFLIKQIGIIRPKLIVLLGSLAAKELCGEKSVTKTHGSIIENVYKYYITLHPAAAVRMKKNVPIIEGDFRKLRSILSDI